MSVSNNKSEASLSARFFGLTSPDFNWRPAMHFILVGILTIMVVLQIVFSLRLINSYFKPFGAGFSTLFRSEKTKIFSSPLSRYQIIDLINRGTLAKSKILVFRESDFGFYGERQFIYYLDEKISDLFLIKTPEETLDYLKKQGITHISLPPYPLPSIYNSGLEKLLASPSYSELQYDLFGSRLFRLRENITAASLTPVIGEDFIKEPILLKNWKYKPAKEKKSNRKPGLLISQTNLLLSTRSNKSLAYRGNIRNKYAPFLNVFSYGFKDDEVYRFTAKVEGSGFLEAFLMAYEQQKGSIVVRKLPLWSGVLSNNNTREIASQFVVSPESILRSFRPRKDWAYGLVFQISSGQYARILDWSIDLVGKSNGMMLEEERLRRALFEEKGWKLEGAVPDGEMLKYGIKNIEGKQSVFLYSFDSRSLILQSPDFSVRTEFWSDYPEGDTGSFTNISFRAKGTGRMKIKALITCKVKSKGSEHDLSTQTEHESSSVFVLSASETRMINTNFYSPCRPKNVKMKLFTEPDRNSAPSNKARPVQIALWDFKMALKYLGKDQKVKTFDLKSVSVPTATKTINAAIRP